MIFILGGLFGERLGKYWLPTDYSEHGHAIDQLFYAIFWLTMAVLIVVEFLLVYFSIKYRARTRNTKAIYTHGNTRLEMVWTLLPAVILIVLALVTKKVWDDYRYAPFKDDPNRVQVLVVGEQFKWNIVYPGPDGELGRYLDFPKVTDKLYRDKPLEKALRAISQVTVLGDNTLARNVDPKNPKDPGNDDDWSKFPGRAIILPVGRPIDVNLTAKDVIHDFFLPNFRVKLDALPGMRGHIYFTARKDGQSTQRIAIDQIPVDRPIWVDFDSAPAVKVSGSQAAAAKSGSPGRFQLVNPAKASEILINGLETLTDASARLQVTVDELKNRLRSANVAELSVVMQPFELVCEELCGSGHQTMRNDVYMVSAREYENYLNKYKPPTSAPPTTKPNVAEGSQEKPAEVTEAVRN